MRARRTGPLHAPARRIARSGRRGGHRLELGLGHLRSWERIAIVGDADWLQRSLHALGWAMPGEIRMFASGEMDAARAWIGAPV